MSFNKISKRKVTLIVILLSLIILIKVFAYDPAFVEKYFTLGVFPGISHLLRLVTGWIPFSLGDVLYFFAGIWLMYKMIYFIVKLVKRKQGTRIFASGMLKFFILAMAVYIIFNIFWGLNYNRKGIASQLGLDAKNYNDIDLKNMQQLLIQKVNESKQILITAHSAYPPDSELFLRANKCYEQTAALYPFMRYKYSSVKSSLFSRWGSYLGFTGYYNPFSGEAQLNTTVPKFVLPYTTCHEMAHQLGYAKEDEANFAGYLAATSSTDHLFHYSTYLDLFVYANNELYLVDSVSAKQAYTQLSQPVKADIKEWRDFLISHRNFMDVFITWAYGKYLKANEQPQGMRTYNEVIGDLIAFYKKTGRI